MMKNFIYLFICLFVINACKAQEKIVDNKKNDLIVFELKNNGVGFIENLYKTKIFRDNEILIVQQGRSPYGSNYFDKHYIFIKEKDTMHIVCYCGQNRNYYFKNLVFKKGSYELRFNFPNKYNDSTKRYEPDKKYVFGNEIKSSKEAQKILFKNANYDMLRKPEYKDLYFKDFKFIEINLKDTTIAKLKKTEKSIHLMLKKGKFKYPSSKTFQE